MGVGRGTRQIFFRASAIRTRIFGLATPQPTARKREASPKGRGGSPSGPKIQARSAVSARQGRLRCKSRTARRSIPTWDFSTGADAPTVSSQPSSFWILFQPGFSRVLFHECRPQVLAARSSALGGCSRICVFYDLLRQGSEFDAFRLARNRSRNQRLDPASRELADLVGPCGHHHAGSCALGSWISARSKCGHKHPRLETMDGACTSIRLAAGFFRAPATRRG